MSFNSKLTDLLKTNPNFVDDEGELLLAAVQDRAWKLDHELIRLLLSDPEMKENFFDDIDGSLLFNTNTFIDYISQKNFLNSSYTRFRNRIGLTIDGKYLNERGEVSLAWAYKDCVLESGQTKEEEKRREFFFNEVLAQDEINRLFDPKVLTNFYRFTPDGKEKVTEIARDKNGIIQENLIIKGNNLLALHSLKEQFRGKISLVYIDPPFNTGKDSFGYNDNFKHSTWLTFMKNRLEVAKELLSENGTIYVHIDSNESHYLKLIMDEVFGRENFLNEIIWAFRERETSIRFYNKKHNVILFYAKNAKSDYVFNCDLIRETYSQVSIKKFKYTDEEGRKYRLRTIDGNSDPSVEDDRTYRQYLDEKGGPLPRDWFVIPFINQASAERTGFSTQKPEELLMKLITASTNEGDIVLDFFLGSGTTIAVSHKLKRQYIGVEQLDSQEQYFLSRQCKVIAGVQTGVSSNLNWKGGGEFIYCELLKFNQAFIERIQNAESSEELLNIWQEMAENSFLNWYINPKMPEDAIATFMEIGKEENGVLKQKKLLMELLDKNQLYVNLSEIDDAKFNVSDEDKAMNRAFYGEN